MRIKFIFVLCAFRAASIAAGLTGCSSDESAPSVQDITFTYGSVAAGSIEQVSISYRVTNINNSSEDSSEAFASVVTLPIGAGYVDGSSAVLNGKNRPPDAQGRCPDGRSYLLYNFQAGEFSDQYQFDTFIGVIQFNVLLLAVADDQDLIVSADAAAPADPCGPLSGDSATFSVFGEVATPVPTQTPPAEPTAAPTAAG